MIDPTTAKEITGIENWFRNRTGRETLFVPSGRVALLLALAEWLRPGDGLLMSPVNDDVVFFTVLAAGIKPVFGPIDPTSGNLDPLAIDAVTWKSVRGVLTTNLYGLPDRMDLLVARCRENNQVLFEDACQAIDTRYSGRRVGSFGDVAIYSLSKHIRGAGGIVTMQDPGRRVALLDRSRVLCRSERGDSSVGGIARRALRRLRSRTQIGDAMGRLRDRIRPPARERAGHRIPYRLDDVLAAQRAGAGMDRFDSWVRVDKPRYRVFPDVAMLRDTRGDLETLEKNLERRRHGARLLESLGLTPPNVRLSGEDALFRVPLFVQDRERILKAMAARGLHLDYIYDPPLDIYAPDLSLRLDPSPSATPWSGDVLPVDPLRASLFMSLLERLGIPAKPSWI